MVQRMVKLDYKIRHNTPLTWQKANIASKIDTVRMANGLRMFIAASYFSNISKQKEIIKA